MKKNKVHKCPTCKNTLEHLYDVNIHNRVIHKKVYQCKKCDKRHITHSFNDNNVVSIDDMLYGGIK